MQIPPENFKLLTELLDQETKGRGRMESLGYAITTGEGKLD